MNDFKLRLREALDDIGMKPIELAEKLGVSRGTISQYLNGRNEVKQERLLKIAKILGVNPAWLLGISDVKHIKEVKIDVSPFLQAHEQNARELGLYPYYFDEETGLAAQELLDNKDLRLLFDAARDCDAATLKKVKQMLEILKQNETKEDD